MQSILRHRIGRRNQVEYLVSWKGYDLADATWEPARNLTNCAELLREYKQRHGLA